jgi:predicted transcriptional regulator
MTTTTIIIELPDELRAKAKTLAQTTGRSLAEVLTGAAAQGLAMLEQDDGVVVQRVLHVAQHRPPDGGDA